MAGVTESLEQKCYTFYYANLFINNYDGPTKSYYMCRINGALENDQEEVTTVTSENPRSNEEVTMVHYDSGQIVKFIPNSLFDTFSNLELLYVYSNNNFKTMKREYLQNANKLKNLHIYQNLLKKIDGNVFSEAKNLEHINFAHNQIESIHKEAFSGLPNLQGVYLQENRIKNLHPKTFSSIANLNVLQLKGGTNCVKEKFTSANQKFPEIEGKISSSCTFELLPDAIEIKIQETNDMIDNLKKANQENFKEMTNKLEEISSQQEKSVNELADQQIKFDAKISDQQKEFDTKIADQQKKFDTKIADQQKVFDAKISSEKLQMEVKNSQIDVKITQMEAKLSAQKLELLQECKSEALQEIVKHNTEQNLALEERINDQKDWNRKYSDEIETTCENNIRLVQIRLTVLETKDD